MFKNYLEGKSVENNKDTEEKSKIEKQVSQMKFKGNQCQFELNANVEGILDKIKEENACTNTPIDKFITEGKKLIKKRQKLIRIADKAKDDWRVVEEYVSDELASDTEDEKRLKKRFGKLAEERKDYKRPKDTCIDPEKQRFRDKGLKIDPEKVKAVQDMPRPTDVEAVHRLNRFVNYLAKFLPKLADSMEPIRRLTHKDVDWVWGEDQEKTFAEVKRLVTSAPVLSYYDPDSDLMIQCDASQKGLGAALLQHGKPIAYISRTLTETEQRYAQIEKEMLAIVFSLEKFNQYTFGRHVKVQSDHKPLEAILKKPLACAPRRLQGRLQKYEFEGWPLERKDLPTQITQFFSIRDELVVQDGVIFKGQRVVIPHVLRKEMKQIIHSSHLGAESCLRRAREVIFWPGMSAEIKEMIVACEICRTYETSPQRETLMPHATCTRPWEQIDVDLFTLDNKDYLITVDYFSNFWEVDRLHRTASNVILKLKNHFARYGCPDRVISDNGPQFMSDAFASFSKAWDFEHRTSSPGNSKANGKAESAVKTAKRLLRKALDAGTEPYLAILEYRNTPTQGMESSPTQRLMNRRTRTLLPTTNALLQPRVVYPETVKDLNRRKQQQSAHFNRNARDLPSLDEGDTVRMKPFRLGEKRWKKATVTSRLNERSYMVETPEGDKYRRNRSHLKKTSENPVTMATADVECHAETEGRIRMPSSGPAQPSAS
ncbi:hypothetical protein QZH41_011513, partial [Actinostola sp. cb2023]